MSGTHRETTECLVSPPHLIKQPSAIRKLGSNQSGSEVLHLCRARDLSEGGLWENSQRDGSVSPHTLTP